MKYCFWYSQNTEGELKKEGTELTEFFLDENGFRVRKFDFFELEVKMFNRNGFQDFSSTFAIKNSSSLLEMQNQGTESQLKLKHHVYE